MERVVRLHMAENIYIHRDAIELIRANLGPAASNEVIGRAAGDIADTLITVEHALCLGDTGQLRRALRHLRSVGEQLGLLQLARDPDTEWNNKTFSEYCTDGMQAWSGGRVLQSRMIRTGPWKYNYYHGYPNQLFNLADDPQEMRNLADEPDYCDIASDLVAELLQDWQPDQIDALIRHRNQCKSVLKAWAGQVQPPDTYRWETRMEDNWLADK